MSELKYIANFIIVLFI